MTLEKPPRQTPVNSQRFPTQEKKAKEFEEEIRIIKGQRSGVSLKYFFMLAGSDDLIKPDRMILRFLENILNRKVSLDEAQKLLKEVSNKLTESCPNINPRFLDHQIWNFQRKGRTLDVGSKC